MSTRIASCSCGQLRAEVEGNPARISICHCLACQQRTGSLFGAQARFDTTTIKTTGDAAEYVRVGDQGTKFSFRFCPVCGATVYYTAEGRSGVVVIPVGAFADPAFPAPSVSFYERRKHPWVHAPQEIEHVL